MYSLQNHQLHLQVAEKGAELTSIKSADGVEFLWQADAGIWPRHAPILFPIVGKLKNNQYHFKHQPYTLPQHGFARDLPFSLIQQQSDCLEFVLHSTEQTKNQYPFDFELSIRYSLNDHEVRVEYGVKNPSSESLYYSIGAHPGFRCPLFPNENFSDYYLQFEKNNYLITRLKDGLLSDNQMPLTLLQGKLPLTHSLFDNDALIFEQQSINRVELCSTLHPRKIILSCNNWPYYGIWSKAGKSPFICLEPWSGITDSVASTQQLEHKKGILTLAPGNAASHSYTMSFY